MPVHWHPKININSLDILAEPSLNNESEDLFEFKKLAHRLTLYQIKIK